MADFGEKVPDARPGDEASDARPGDEASEAAPADEASEAAGQPDPEPDDGPTEAQKRKRLIASRVVVAGVGLTFLIVGFVQFITK